jgi:molecular chaperone GrpE (heat shock protein)
LIISIIYRKKIKENSNLQLKKTKRANKIAQKRLKVAARQLKAGNNEAFYEELSKGLWGYLSDKLAIAGAELTRDNVRQVLEKNGAQSGNTERLLEILDNCEYARYAPAGEESQRENLYEASIEVISKLENNLKRKNQ